MKYFKTKKEFYQAIKPYLQEKKEGLFKTFILDNQFKKDYNFQGFINDIIVETQNCNQAWLYSKTGYYLCNTSKLKNTCIPSIYKENQDIFKKAYKSHKEACLEYLYIYFNN